ncbi:hypothetical protein JNUCC32_20150 [Paenibacillus sp. JNUCC32]|uniref:DUF6339 family protein n=1 Tax=Paenibacillus sp. JNUCC32 TaxID=2777984 RepID=UPI00178896D4|nr:DUF6339 family protein [Paenibacillus sp. JNUCC-32]QOT08464.1 hypothetical protein JNUCC32_20150 [Paenibacillus sp. JNUCC-32]
MELNYISESSLDELKVNILSNIERYTSDEVWIYKFFEGTTWNFPSTIRIENIDLHMPQSSTLHFDFENTKKIYTSLKGLSVIQATDERLWTYLTHNTFWNYMRKRWPVESYLEKEKPVEAIKERYFFMANRDRALIRNGIARLWWYGYVSYDENREDPFELTKVLLSKLDIAQSLLERSFSRNPDITKAVLSVLKQKELETSFIDRENFRSLMMYINQLGGVTILDTLDREDLEELVREKIEALS